MSVLFSFYPIIVRCSNCELCFSLPTWTEKVFYPGCELEKLAAFNFAMSTNTKLLARLRAGFLLRDMFDRFAKKANGTLSPDRSLWIYSAHDKTIANVLNALGLFEVGFSFISLFSKNKIMNSPLVFVEILKKALEFSEKKFSSISQCYSVKSIINNRSIYYSHRTFPTMLHVFFSNFTNPITIITLKFITNESEVKTLNHWNHLIFQIVAKTAR